jgi:N-dimethylarginine dimethylaminohydrolase
MTSRTTPDETSVPAMGTAGDGEHDNPTRLHLPCFLVNAPFSYNTSVANNAWMLDIADSERVPDARRAMVQFLELYRYLTAEALVYVLPTPTVHGLQDLPFTANLGIVLEHLPGRNTVVIANYTSEPRRAETAVGVRFFESMGYRTFVPEWRFEGEAELKHLHDNVYVGGYGLRSERQTYAWMDETFEMKVVPLELTDPYLYHLDCAVFPLAREQTLVCTELFGRDEVKQLEQHTEIIDVSLSACYSGICNSVRLNNVLLNASHLHDLRRGTSEYDEEIAKNRMLEDIASRMAFEVAFFNLSEYHKGGALLSCMVMHLNRFSYHFRMI